MFSTTEETLSSNAAIRKKVLCVCLCLCCEREREAQRRTEIETEEDRKPERDSEKKTLGFMGET